MDLAQLALDQPINDKKRGRHLSSGLHCGLAGAYAAPTKQQLISYAKLAIRALCVFFIFQLGIPTVPVNSLSLTCLLNFLPKSGVYNLYIVFLTFFN